MVPALQEFEGYGQDADPLCLQVALPGVAVHERHSSPAAPERLLSEDEDEKERRSEERKKEKKISSIAFFLTTTTITIFFSTIVKTKIKKIYREYFACNNQGYEKEIERLND